MCGVAGIHAYHTAAPGLDRAELEAMAAALAPRGPDGAGRYLGEEGRLGLTHRRLALVGDLREGEQPRVEAELGVVVLFNGELYEHRRERLAEGLPEKGSEAELIAHRFRSRGPGSLLGLRGMYAMAIWDRREKALHLIRDRDGIKPLHYHDDGWTLRFGSTVSALEAALPGLPIEEAGLAGFLLFGSVPQPWTIRRGVLAVPAGAHLRIDGRGLGRATFPAGFPAGGGDPLAELRRSARLHLRGDAPVALWLSAGADSRALLSSVEGRRLAAAVTVRFEGEPGETSGAAAAAERAGVRHVERPVSLAEWRQEEAAFLAAMDQPTIDGANSWFAAKATRELGLACALSGVGGDELFAGYPSFTDLPRWRRLAPLSRVPGAGAAGRLAARVLAPGRGPKASGFLRHLGTRAGRYLLRRGLFLPEDLPRLLGVERAREALRRLDWPSLVRGALTGAESGERERVSSLEYGLYLRNQLLRDTDWAAMAHGVEVRTPFCDQGLRAALGGCPGEKAELRRLAGGSFPESKRGFASPMAAGLRGDGSGELLRRRFGLPEQTPWARLWALRLLEARGWW
jgi:asparagine synthase (glutamine-hydrolysing)